MRIDDALVVHCYFKDLEVGSTFEYEYEYYLKCSELDGTSIHYNAVNLSTGDILSFSKTAEVTERGGTYVVF